MSAAVAGLVFIAGCALLLVIDLLVPFEADPLLDDVERGSTTIMPEDR